MTALCRALVRYGESIPPSDLHRQQFASSVRGRMWFIQVLSSFSALRILNGEVPLQAFESTQLQALAGLQLDN